MIASIAAVNVLAVMVIARLGRRLSGTERERLPSRARNAITRPARITERSASHGGVTGSDLEHERGLSEPAEVSLAPDEHAESIAGQAVDG